jgi:hypothetical protein
MILVFERVKTFVVLEGAVPRPNKILYESSLPLLSDIVRQFILVIHEVGKRNIKSHLLAVK